MDQRVIVTANASGIGLAIANRFTATDAKVHIIDMDSEAVETVITTTNITGTVTDISDQSSAGNAVIVAIKTLNGIDAPANNAGIAGPNSLVADYPVGVWCNIIDMNLTGTFMVTAAIIPHLIKADAASIVFISSLAGRFDYFHRSAYSTPKWGQIGLAKILAMELGPDGVTSNTILPGAVAEDRLEAVFAGRADANSRTATRKRNQAFLNQSVQRFAQADEIADLAFFLTGSSARSIS